MKAKKSLGQNFLINEGIIDKIISVSSLTLEDVVVEIGPGRGALTERISPLVKRLICIEKDDELARDLTAKYSKSNIEILNADALKIDLKDLNIGSYKVVANIPYYITSNLIRNVLYEWPKPERIILMVQREVADRIIAKPPRMNLLAVFAQLASDVKKEFNVSAGSFRPIPNVDSAVISLTPKPNFVLEPKLEELIKQGFSQKRKKLVNNLSKVGWLNKENLKLNLKDGVRAEELSVEEWINLFKNILE